MAQNIEGDTSTNIVKVTSDLAVQVNQPTTLGQFGGVAVASLEGPVGGRPTEVSGARRVRVGCDAVLFCDQFAYGTGALNGSVWSPFNTTYVLALLSGTDYLSFNSTNQVAASSVSLVRTQRCFSFYGSFPTLVDMWATYNGIGVVNSTIVEIGLFFATTTTDPTDGYLFRWAKPGEFCCVVVYNGVVWQTGPLTPPTCNIRHHFRIVAGFDRVSFVVDDVVIATFTAGAEMPLTSRAMSLPLTLRQYNTASGTPQFPVSLQVYAVRVSLGDSGVANRPWEILQVGQGSGAYQGPVNSGTYTQTANYVANTIPTMISLDNTGAGGTCYPTLGGQFYLAQPNGSETDGIIFKYQNPVGTPQVPGKNLYISAVYISTVNTVAVITVPTILQWGLAIDVSQYGSDGVTLSTGLTTTESAISHAARRIPLGRQSFNTGGNDPDTGSGGVFTAPVNVSARINPPALVQSGDWAFIILKVVSGSSTPGNILRGTVMINGYFE